MDGLPSYAASDVATIQQVLSANGYPPPDIQSAVEAYTGMTSGELTMAGQAVQGMLDGEDPIHAAAPLLGAAMLASGVGAPAAAAVAAGLELFESFAKTLGPKNDCSDGYQIGGDATWSTGRPGGTGSASSICVHTPRPRGPKSQYWNPLDATIASWRKGFASWVDAMEAGVDTGASGANVAMYRQVVDIELPAIAQLENIAKLIGQPLAPEIAFEKAFCLAWKSNAERAINGHPVATLPNLLAALRGAWNATRVATSTVTIPESMGYVTSERDPQVRTHDSVVSVLLAGHLDPGGAAGELGPLTINAGPPPLKTIAIFRAGSAPAKPVKKGLPAVFHLPSPAAIIESAKPNLTPQQYATLKAHWETPPPAPAPATYSVLGLKVPKTYAKVGGVIAAGAVALKLIF